MMMKAEADPCFFINDPRQVVHNDEEVKRNVQVVREIDRWFRFLVNPKPGEKRFLGDFMYFAATDDIEKGDFLWASYPDSYWSYRMREEEKQQVLDQQEKEAQEAKEAAARAKKKKVAKKGKK